LSCSKQNECEKEQCAYYQNCSLNLKCKCGQIINNGCDFRNDKGLCTTLEDCPHHNESAENNVVGKQLMDINYNRKECNNVDSAEMLMCIQAWHEMINPGHHHINLHADGSGSVEYAANCPKVYDIPLSDR